jgi:predicted kinase
MLQRIDAGVWIEKAWRTQQQRQNDMAIMDAFASDPEITPLMMILANEYRMWLRVIYVSWKAQQSHLKNLEYKRMESGSYQ